MNQSNAPQSATIQAWMTSYLAKLMALNESDVNVDKTFTRFGLDSASTAAMAGELGEWLGIEIDPSVAYDYPTIRKISGYIAEHLPAQQSPVQLADV